MASERWLFYGRWGSPQSDEQNSRGLTLHRVLRQRMPSRSVVSGIASCSSHRPSPWSHSTALQIGIELSRALCRSTLWRRQAVLHWVIEVILSLLDERKLVAPLHARVLVPSVNRQQPDPTFTPSGAVLGLYHPEKPGSQVGLGVVGDDVGEVGLGVGNELGLGVVGDGVGLGVGDVVGLRVGLGVGDEVGEGVGLEIGVSVGDGVGEAVGLGVGVRVGVGVGSAVGLAVGLAVRGWVR